MHATSASFTGTVTAAPARAARKTTPSDRMTDTRPTLLHITPSIGGGGAETLLVNLVEAMHGGAWRTVVVAVDGRAWPDQADRLHKHTEAYHDLESPAFLRGSVLRKLHEIIRAVKPDVVQTWMHHADLIGGISARLAGVRHIAWGIHCREIHRNSNDSNTKMKVFRSALATISKFIPRRIISCSAAAIEDHVALGYPRKKMQWIPNGICTKKFAPRPEAGSDLRSGLGIPSDAPLVGYAGRFHEMKQLETFFRAAALVQQALPQTHFILCGGTADDLDTSSRAAWSQLPLRDRVHFIPFRANMERFYPALTLFSLSSRTEAFPMTLLEAMACGVPCAATDAGDCATLIGDSTFTARGGDAAGLASIWKNIITLDATARAELSRKLRDRVENNFTIAHTAHQYESIYAGLVAHRA
ncbi:MAG: glycosyltransferase [Verrucomicrobia bacterium]|nr:glycosyltransferase [Verrucomicrobiota bacterium]